MSDHRSHNTRANHDNISRYVAIFFKNRIGNHGINALYDRAVDVALTELQGLAWSQQQQAAERAE
ncbi:hypothetical protein AA106556_1444 [Neokomagataea tanensis NBRC 106556]|uniref:Transposase n=1 Tax=Neokomagataea tanensis NBRC 106556 TaxID=1223519 RepID=A0ABQ0QJV6_9PROT|nr:hypothetical protein AA106556_1444 [Neokomagataea tanensis NBRC 106556]